MGLKRQSIYSKYLREIQEGKKADKMATPCLPEYLVTKFLIPDT